MVYSPAYTVGSLLLAIGVVGIAFLVLSSSESLSPLKIVIGGIICGAAICGMHYVGQLGLINYWNVWDSRYILGSAAIAVVAATAALGIFFWQKSIWTNALWKRLLCACCLAAAVSLMHWVSILGTSYAWQGNPGLVNGVKRKESIWVSSALALSCCTILLAFTILWRHVSSLSAKKARQISLALAYWDHEHRIMLNPSGLLPSTKITRSYVQHSFKNQFDIDHPIFSWLFRVSRNWSCVRDNIANMRQHIRSENPSARSYSLDGVSGDKDTETSLTFKQLFCVAAHDLACSLDVPLTEIGVLFDKVLDTGSVTLRHKAWSHRAATITSHDTNDTSSIRSHAMTLGRGQVRRRSNAIRCPADKRASLSRSST